MKKIAAIAALTLATSAQAGVITSTAALNLETTEINQSLSLNQFDSSLGTLTGVDITLFGQGVSAATVQNTAAQAQTFKFESTLDLLFSGPALSSVVSIPLFATGFVNIASQATLDLGSVNLSDQATVSIAAADFAAFVGAGTIGLGCQSFVSNTQTGGGGNIVVTQNTQAGCGAQVTYTFADAPPPSSVPEPGTLAMAGLGLLGLGAMRRRK